MKPVSEIKLLFCELAGCTSHKTVHPEIAPCTLPIYSNNKWLKKRAHTGCTPSKIVHPSMEMCTQGAPLISDTGDLLSGYSWHFTLSGRGRDVSDHNETYGWMGTLGPLRSLGGVWTRPISEPLSSLVAVSWAGQLGPWESSSQSPWPAQVRGQPSAELLQCILREFPSI